MGFHENQSSDSPVVPCGRTDGRTERHDVANSHFRILPNYQKWHPNNHKQTVSDNKIYEVPAYLDIQQMALRNSKRSVVRATGRRKNINRICTFHISTGCTVSHLPLFVGTVDVFLSSLHSSLPFQTRQWCSLFNPTN